MIVFMLIVVPVISISALQLLMNLEDSNGKGIL